jgi:hypothetical protein
MVFNRRPRRRRERRGEPWPRQPAAQRRRRVAGAVMCVVDVRCAPFRCYARRVAPARCRSVVAPPSHWSPAAPPPPHPFTSRASVHLSLSSCQHSITCGPNNNSLPALLASLKAVHARQLQQHTSKQTVRTQTRQPRSLITG